MGMDEERRKYRRIQAAVYCRPAGVGLLERRREAVDISLGGVRVFSDDSYRIGALVKMEVFRRRSTTGDLYGRGGLGRSRGAGGSREVRRRAQIR